MSVEEEHSTQPLEHANTDIVQDTTQPTNCDPLPSRLVEAFANRREGNETRHQASVCGEEAVYDYDPPVY